MALFRTCLALAILATLFNSFSSPTRAENVPAQAPMDYSVPNGHFFTQANGSGGGGNLGYRVMDDAGVPFWTAFQQLGGVEVVGYPVSRRFLWKGLFAQAFQKLVLQWHPDTKSISFVNVFDEMNLAGKDTWLRSVRATPARLTLDEKGKSWDQVVAGRLAFLDASPAIKAKYFEVADYIDRYGLPTSRVEDVGNAYVVRFQRAVIQQWKMDVPWASAGQVSIANGGDIGKEAGLYPKDAIQLENIASDSSPTGAPKNPGALKIVLDPGHGGPESGATHTFNDGSVLREKDVNLKVALKAADELGKIGYNVILTRRADAHVNDTRDITGDGLVNLNDDLQARIDIANNANADILVSMHENGINSDIRGTEVYYCSAKPFADKSLKLATFAEEALVNGLQAAGYSTVYRGAREDSLALGAGNHYFLLGPQSDIIARPSQMPAIIGEPLFVSNDDEANLLRQDNFLGVIAHSYVLAINRYFVSEGK